MLFPKNPQIYNCELCKDIKYIPAVTEKGNSAVTPCRCLMLEAKRRCFGDYFLDKNLDNYEARTPSMASALKLLKGNPVGSYYIYGNVGLGKTHLVAGLYEANYNNGRWTSTHVLTETQLTESIKDYSIRAMLRTASTFVIDDLGKIEVAKWDIEALFNFYNEVYRNDQALIISSNYSLQALSGIYGGAISRRIEERCEILNIISQGKK